MKTYGFGQTDVGRKRRKNEDTFVVNNVDGIYIVCDGVGGHAAGEVASATAARAAHETLRKDPALQSDDVAAIKQAAARAVLAACAEVHKLAETKWEYSGMATTMTMVVTAGPRAVMAHVGDSLLFLLRKDKLSKLSNDHTFFDELVRSGTPPEQAKKSPYARMISRVLGLQPRIKVDVLSFDLFPDDTLLLCTDGLTRGFDDPAGLKEYLRQEDIEQIPARLIDLANVQGGKDNITGVAVRLPIGDLDPETAEQWTRDYQERVDALESTFLFESLDADDMARILERIEIRVCRPKEGIAEENRTCDRMFVVLSGRVSLSREKREVTQLGPNRSFGELWLLEDRPARCSIRSIAETRLLVLERARFRDLVRRDSALGAELMERMARAAGRRLDRISADLYELDPLKVAEDVVAPIWV